MTEESAQLASVHLETTIAAAPEVVWRALTEQIGAWWPAEFYAGGEAGRRRYRLEATPGGRMLEEYDGGGGVVWGTVASVVPGRKLQVHGATFPDWGGPNLWFGTWELEAVKGGTRMRFAESSLGRIGATLMDEKTKGWRFLFDGALKAFVEGKPAPLWSEAAGGS